MANVSNLGEYLKQEFLNGQGVVTQGPGRYAPGVVEKLGGPTINKGYDIGVAPGTPINTSKLKYRGATQDKTGYGLRANYYDPRTNQSYFFSHLSKLAPGPNGQMIAYTGGIPGIHGRSTGPHLDIDMRQGMADFGNSFMGGLNAISGAMGRATRPKIDINAILERGKNTAKSQGKRLVAYASNPNRLQGIASKVKGSIVKL